MIASLNTLVAPNVTGKGAYTRTPKEGNKRVTRKIGAPPRYPEPRNEKASSEPRKGS